jgi:hypothetical protein
MAKQKYEMTTGEKFWYYAVNIFTWGSLYLVKTAIKKALSEEQK